jgi:hypothetical protein
VFLGHGISPAPLHNRLSDEEITAALLMTAFIFQGVLRMAASIYCYRRQWVDSGGSLKYQPVVRANFQSYDR